MTTRLMLTVDADVRKLPTDEDDLRDMMCRDIASEMLRQAKEVLNNNVREVDLEDPATTTREDRGWEVSCSAGYSFD